MKKILSKLTVFVLAAAVMLFSCEKDGTEGTDLRIISDKDVKRKVHCDKGDVHRLQCSGCSCRRTYTI